MNTEPLFKFVVFVLIFVLCLMLEVAYSRFFNKRSKKKYKTHHYPFAKYALFIFLPTVLTLYFLKEYSSNFLLVFIGFSILGTFFEGIFGFAYHAVFGQRMWTYHKYSIFGYTSLLSVPMWGVAGLICYLLMQVFI